MTEVLKEAWFESNYGFTLARFDAEARKSPHGTRRELSLRLHLAAAVDQLLSGHRELSKQLAAEGNRHVDLPQRS